MNKQIVVIGSGPSGVAAATRLLSNGFTNVIILEAEDRIGGRINTIDFGANVLDLGAQWCHGEGGNVVYEMAKDKDLLSPNTPDLKITQCYRSNGEEAPRHLTDKLLKLGDEILEEDDKEKDNYNGSVGNFFAETYYEKLKSEEFNDVDRELKRQVFDFSHRRSNILDASDSWYELSYRSYDQYLESPGEQTLTWKDKGYKTALDLLQKKIPSTPNNENVIDVLPHVQFNKEVQQINYADSLSSAAPIRIKCIDGSVFNADHVICTVSLGVLKERHLTLFDPLLPSDKFDSIDGMSFGTVDKIYLEYDQPFWNENWSQAAILWLPEQLKEIREDPVNGDWLDGLVTFHRVSFQPNILCTWITGPKARIMEQKSLSDVKAGVEKALRMVLSKSFNIPDAKSIKRSTWHSNPHFRGSYSYYSLKSDALSASTTKLAEPIKSQSGTPVIQFAGEATSPHHFSTVHGAVETGWREAQRLIDLYSSKTQS